MHDLMKLYLSALRSGDRPLAAALARALRAQPTAAGSADRSLQELPRGPARWSAAAELVVGRVMRRLGSGLS
jgi:hypothetical protein